MTTSPRPNLTSLAVDDKLAALEIPDVVTVDTEGVKTMMGISVAFSGISSGMYFPVDHEASYRNLTSSQRDKLFSILRDKKALVFHNAVHDIRVLARNGFNYTGQFYDTMLMCHWIDEEMMNYKLDFCSQYYGGQPKAMPAAMSALLDSDGWSAVPTTLMDEYSSNDAWITHELFETILPLFEKEGFDGPLWATEQEFICKVMGPMIDRGIRVDMDFAIKEYLRGTAIMEECQKELGFKPTSPVALGKFLLDELKLPVVKHTKACTLCPKGNPVAAHQGKPSFDKDAMAEYDELLDKREDKRAKTILKYRGWLKTTSSNYKPYLTMVDSNQVIHPGYKLHGTRTGRLSCAEPNLQQIPKSSDKDWNGGLKKVFIPREGYQLWSVDFRQLQFRMTCAYAKQEDLLKIFRDPQQDIFTSMAEQMHWKRDHVKTLVYLILFGGGAKKAATAFNVSVSEGHDLVEEFHLRYPEIRKVSKQAEQAARRMGRVSLWTGRRRHFRRRGATTPPYYRAFNAAIQGGEAEIIKRAMIELEHKVCNEEECRLILQIHDELVFEIATGKEDFYLPLVQKVMENAAQEFAEWAGVDIPFPTSVSKWGQK